MTTIRQRALALLAAANPLDDAPPDQARAARLVVVVSTLIVLTTAFYGVVFALMGSTFGAAAAFTSSLIATAGLVAFPHHRQIGVGAHGLAGSLFIGVAGCTWVTGGFHSVGVSWFLLVAMLASMLGGRRAGIVWLAAGLFALLGLYTAALAGWEAPYQVPDAFRGPFGFVVPAGLMLCTFGVTMSYEVAQQRAMGRVLDASRTTEHARAAAVHAHAHARAILDSVTEGLVIVNGDGTLQPARSASLDGLLGEPAPGARVWELFEPSSARTAGLIEFGWDQLTAGWLPREVALAQLPKRMHAGGQTLELSWSQAGHGDEVMLVVSDITERLMAEAEAAEHQEIVTIVSHMARDRPGVLSFLAEGRRIVDELESGDGSEAQELRGLHTLKGNSAVMGLARLAGELHQLETAIDERGGHLLAGERVSLGVRWSRFEDRLRTIMGTHDTDTVWVPVCELNDTVAQVKTGAPRMVVAGVMEAWAWDAVDDRLQHLARQAERLAERTHKDVVVVVDAPGLRSPPTEAWRAMWAAMVHLVRNAVDHGIEEDRAVHGKPNQASLRLRASRKAHALRVEIEDDGAGIDWPKIEAKATALGLPVRTDQERMAALFSDGVTSRDEITDLSGRGVGSAAIREAVARLGGEIEVDSVRGQHTRFVLTLPLGSTTPTYEATTPVSA